MANLHESLNLTENSLVPDSILIPDSETVGIRQLLNMTAGSFGIQFGWSLQNANMSAIFEYLGANPHDLPLLWLAAPLTGLIVQPIVGYFSDRTWGILGRRRPYFLLGGVLSAITLVIIPNASTLWLAVLLLWVLDTSVNISMEPFRAFLGDLLPESQHAQGFALQSTIVSAGAILALMLPWFLSHTWNPIQDGAKGLPITVKLAFYIGAFIFLATILWTVFTTTEHPPTSEESKPTSTQQQSWQVLKTAVVEIPTIMQQLAWVQGFTWVGMFCVFLYLPTMVAWNLFHAPSENSVLYRQGIEWAGLGLVVDNAVCVVFARFLPKLIYRFGSRLTHSLCLLCGGMSLISLWVVHDPWLFFLPMAGLGVAWASILTIPYTLLMAKLPAAKRGIYTGIFNLFIVIPQIMTSLGMSWAMQHIFQENRLAAIVVGGFSMVLAALCMQRVQES